MAGLRQAAWCWALLNALSVVICVRAGVLSTMRLKIPRPTLTMEPPMHACLNPGCMAPAMSCCDAQLLGSILLLFEQQSQHVLVSFVAFLPADGWLLEHQRKCFLIQAHSLAAGSGTLMLCLWLYGVECLGVFLAVGCHQRCCEIPAPCVPFACCWPVHTVTLHLTHLTVSKEQWKSTLTLGKNQHWN